MFSITIGLFGSSYVMTVGEPPLKVPGSSDPLAYMIVCALNSWIRWIASVLLMLFRSRKTVKLIDEVHGGDPK